MENTNIFICTYEDFLCKVKNNSYKILNCGSNNLSGKYSLDVINNNTDNNISNLNKFYGELSGMYSVWKNYNLPDYVGFCNNHKYFNFNDNIPNLKELNCDLIIPNPIGFEISIYEQYKMYHNIEDLDFCINYIKSKYNIAEDAISKIFYENNILMVHNMFLTNKEIFNNYCSFFFDIMNEYLKSKNCSNISDINQMIINNYDNYITPDKNKSNDFINYQSKIGSFLSERLFTFFVIYNNYKCAFDSNINSNINSNNNVRILESGVKIING